LLHPSLPTIYDYFSDAGQSYLVMDFIEGETLEDYLAKTSEGWLPIKTVLALGIRLCSVLDYLHTRQPPIIFRDLKPSNVMWAADDKIFLIDFGIARHFKPGQMKDTVSFGSAGYAAPEQYGKTQTTPRSDIYSLGAMLHQCLTGNDPSGNNPTPFNFPPLDLHGQVATAGLEPLIRKMLAMDPAKRPASMSLVRKELELITKQQEIMVLQKLKKEMSTTSANIANYTIVPVNPTPPPVAPSNPTPDPAAQTIQRPAPVLPLRITKSPVRAEPKTITYGIYRGHTGTVRSISWSPDGRCLVSGDNTGNVQVWSAFDRLNQYACRYLYTYTYHINAIQAVAWSPDGKHIAVGDNGGLITVWNVTDVRRIYTYHAYAVAVTGIAWSPDGKRIASSDSSGRVLVQDALTGNHAYVYQGHSASVQTVAWSPDGKYIASGDSKRQILVWDADKGDLFYSYQKHTAKINAVVWLSDSRRIASCDNAGKVHVWSPVETSFSFVYDGHFGEIGVLACSPDGKRIASAEVNTTVQIWDAVDGGHVFIYREHGARVSALAWSPDGNTIVSADTDKTLLVWKAK
ncbi:MAG TPA: serine/threonine-protein kinase, partial [Ktedonosporobacter sp.]|nr:serine/threonine-protein kinase [Ktedonosporobacter sp.]